MIITLDPEMETMLRKKARREGQEPQSVAKMLLTSSLEADAQEYRETVEALREALASGPGKPIEQYLAEQRVKHGYSDDWPQRGVASEVSPGVFVENE